MIAALDARPMLKRALIWAVPMGLLLIIIGVELYLASTRGELVPAATTRPPNPVNVAVLPAYTIGSGGDSLSAIGEHTLFNPTRRPAPPAPAPEAGASRIPRGQYVLTGTTVYGDSAVAYLKNTKDGKPVTVRKGDKLEGMQVADVTPNSVKLGQGSDSEELVLKVAAGPKMTIQPAVVTTTAAPQGAGGGTGAAPAPAPAANVAQQQGPGGGNARRRAATAANANQGGSGNTSLGNPGNATGGSNAMIPRPRGQNTNSN